MAQPICPLCESTGQSRCFTLAQWDLLRCEGCGLFHVDPQPNVREADDAAGGAGEPGHDMPPERLRLYDIQFYRRHFDRIDRECREARSILDVGCGTGMLLELLGKYADMRRVGIELDPRRAEFARRATGCEIHLVPVEEFSSPERFDVITLINVLSHIQSLNVLFASLRELLSRRGRIVLKTGELAGDVRVGDVRDWGIPEHCQFLGTGTIGRICERHGLKVLRHERTGYARELFSRESFNTPGSTRARRIVKKLIASVPGALPALAACYELAHGRRVFSAFIVLARADEA